MERAAIYTRVSSAGQERDGTSLETQLEQVRHYCAEHDYRIVDEFEETHTGTDLWERERLSDLRDNLAQGHYDVIVIHNLDRYSRDPVHLMILLDEAAHHDARVEFVLDPGADPDSPDGKLILFVKGYAANREHQLIKERTQRGRVARAKHGKLIPGPKPLYGYAFNEDRSKLMEDPPTASVVRDIFSLYATEGMSAKRVALELTNRQIPTPTGRHADWHPATVYQIITHEFYKGKAASFRLSKTKDKHGKLHQKPSGRAIALPDGTVPALVSETLWGIANAGRSARRTYSSRSAAHVESFLLRGMVVCSICGGRMHGQARRSGTGAFLYVCTTHHNTPARCAGMVVPSEALDAKVWNWAYAIFSDPSIVQERLSLKGPLADPYARDIDLLRRTLKDVEKEKQRLTLMLGRFDDERDAEPVVERLKMLGTQQRRVASDLDEMLERSRSRQADGEQLRALAEWCGEVGRHIARASYAQKRLVLATMHTQVLIAHGADLDDRVSLSMQLASNTTSCTSYKLHWSGCSVIPHVVAEQPYPDLLPSGILSLDRDDVDVHARPEGVGRRI